LNIKSLSYYLFLAFTSLTILELALHFSGFKPGFLVNYKNFNFSEKPKEIEFYTTDEVGIYKLSKFISDSLIHFYNTNTLKFELTDDRKDLIHIDNLQDIFTDFHILSSAINARMNSFSVSNLNEINWQTPFAKKAYKSIANNESDAHIFSSYLNKPLNSEGFRGIDIDLIHDEKIKIMLVGDSFGWGLSATPIYNSYPDILLAKGYLVYNFGIPGTDPPQYEKIVEKYLPLIKPDVVIVTFSHATDFIAFPRIPNQFEPIEHQTNKGFIQSNPLGYFMDFEDAYQYYFNISIIPTEISTFNYLFAKSNVTTQLWRVLFLLKITNHPLLSQYIEVEDLEYISRAKVVAPYFKKISEICENNNVKLINVVIPSKPFFHF
jgi:hypothetical protein